MPRSSFLVLAAATLLLAPQLRAAVSTVETRISNLDDQTVLVEHLLTGIRNGAHIPLSAMARDVDVSWINEVAHLDFRGQRALRAPSKLMPFVDGPIVALAGSGERASVRYRLPLTAGIINEPMGAARLYRTQATVALAVELGSQTITYSPSHSLSQGRALGTPSSPLPDTPLLVLPLNPQPGQVAAASLAVAPSGDEDGFLLIALAGRAAGQRDPLNIAFAMDVSGSMRGEKLAQAKRALHDAVAGLQPHDHFELISFNHEVTHHSVSEDQSLAALIDSLQAGGLTNISDALLLPAHKGLVVDTIVLFTDGLPNRGITSEQGMRQAVASAYDGGAVSIHTIGLGHDVNAPLLDALASAHGGSSSYIAPNDDVRTGVASLLSQLSHPVARGLSLSAVGGRLLQAEPAMDAIGDLHDGQVRVLLARYRQPGPITLRINERVGGAINERGSLQIALPEHSPPAHALIRRLWATRAIARLEGTSRMENRVFTNEESQAGNRLLYRYGVVTTNNMSSVSAFNDGAAATTAVEDYDQQVRSFAHRSGQRAVEQAVDWRRAVEADSQRQRVMASDGQDRDISDGVRNFAGATAIRQETWWIDGDLVAEQAVAAVAGEEPPQRPVTQIQRQGEGWEDLVSRLLESPKRELLGIEGQLRLLLDGVVYEVQ